MSLPPRNLSLCGFSFLVVCCRLARGSTAKVDAELQGCIGLYESSLRSNTTPATDLQQTSQHGNTTPAAQPLVQSSSTELLQQGSCNRAPATELLEQQHNVAEDGKMAKI
jgi:hypothetical protein